MKVRELVALLMRANQEDYVIVNSDSQSLLLVNARPGLFQPMDEEEAALTEGEYCRAT